MFKINSLNELEKFVSQNWNDLNLYLDREMEKTPPSLYTSVDIRESASKIAPVDNNLYPAGFNNLCQRDLDKATDVFAEIFRKNDIKKIGIYPESNTKNLFYLDHLAILGKTIRDSGIDVSFVSLDENLFADNNSIELTSHSKYKIEINKAKIVDQYLCLPNDERLDFCLLNNDQSVKIGIEWEKIETKVCPSPLLGWYNREKGIHFELYSKVSEQFCKEFSINPSLIQAQFKAIHDVDFNTKEGLEALAKTVDELKTKINANQKIFIKANKGTYGMGISVISNGNDVLQMNRKKRNKMDIGKNKLKFTSIIAQEGIETVLKYDSMPAEVTIYLVNGKSVGGFMRANSSKDSHSNLNSRGMVFKKFCISEIRENQDYNTKEALYTIVARLSTLAAGHELDKIRK